VIVYLITNLINGKMYVGQTVCTLSDRWSQHKYAARRKRGHSHLYSAIRKHGSDAFKVEVLCACSTEKELFEQERHLIEVHGTKNPKRGYNLTDGGEIGPRGMVHSKVARRKMSRAHSGKNHHMFGKHHSDETRDKIAESNTGKIASQAARDKMSRARKGVPKSAAHRCKLEVALAKARAVQTPAERRERGQQMRSLLTPEQLSTAGCKGGPKGMHVRWHVNRGVMKPDCKLCQGGVAV